MRSDINSELLCNSRSVSFPKWFDSHYFSYSLRQSVVRRRLHGCALNARAARLSAHESVSCAARGGSHPWAVAESFLASGHH